MSEHFIVTMDHGHLRIYAERQSPGQMTPGWEQVEAMDFPAGRASYVERDADMAGRFASSKHPGAGSGRPNLRTGMSIDERLPMKREASRRRAKDLVMEIESFLQSRPDATWDFAAGPELNGTVLELLSPAVRRRIRRAVVKDLVNQRLDDVRAHFAGA